MFLLYYSTNLHVIYFLKTKANKILFNLLYSEWKKIFSEKMIVTESKFALRVKKIVNFGTKSKNFFWKVLTMANRLRIKKKSKSLNFWWGWMEKKNWKIFCDLSSFNQSSLYLFFKNIFRKLIKFSLICCIQKKIFAFIKKIFSEKMIVPDHVNRYM